MTLVVGLVNQAGVLLCADTLVSSDVAVAYESKILPVRFPDGRALIGYSGFATFAKSAIERIEVSLNRYSGGPRSLDDIVQNIRKVWFACFKESHSGKDLSGDQILAAIWSTRDQGVRLYCSSNESFAESVQNSECIGFGDLVGRFVMGSGAGGIAIPERRAFERAVRAVGLAKDFLPSSIGGRLIAVNLSGQGLVHIHGWQDVHHVESYASDLDGAVRELSDLFFSTLMDPRALDDVLTSYSAKLRYLQEFWQSDATRNLLPDSIPPEAEGIWRAFNEADQ
jgi:hypothetical protein